MEWKSTPAAIWAAALWYTLLGGFLAAFAFWQSLTAGIAFAAVWLLLGLWLLLVVLPTWRVRMTPRELEVSVGVLFPILHRMPRLTVCGLQRVTTPVLRRAGLCLAWVHGAGGQTCLLPLPVTIGSPTTVFTSIISLMFSSAVCITPLMG